MALILGLIAVAAFVTVLTAVLNVAANWLDRARESQDIEEED